MKFRFKNISRLDQFVFPPSRYWRFDADLTVKPNEIVEVDEKDAEYYRQFAVGRHKSFEEI